MNKQLLKNWIDANGPNGAEKLCAAAELSFATISKLLNETNRLPNVRTAQKIAKALGVGLEELLTDVETPKNTP